MRQAGRIFLIAVGAALALASPSGAVQITLAGPSTGVFTVGQRVANATVGDTITLTVGLDSATPLNGYDLTIAWDASELSFLSVGDLSGLGLDTVPPGVTSAGERIAALELLPVSTSLLFEVTFHVDAVVVDGLADFSLLLLPANGAGLSPGSVTLDNPSLPAVAIPEPALAALLCLGLSALASTGGTR